jgi:glycosyltransferase involved in cell wall biosynthesis
MSGRAQWIVFAANARPSFTQRALASRLAPHAPVILVIEALSLMRSGRLKPFADRIACRSDLPLLREYHPIHYPERVPALGPMLKAHGARRLRRELGVLLAQFGEAPRIVCYDSPSQYPLAGTLGEAISVYLAIDDRTVTVRGESIAGELEAERRLLARVDRVVCVSEALAETLRARACERADLRIDVLANGYDEMLFDPQRVWAEPVPLRAVRRPRVLVAGHVSERIDWDGIAAAARLRPDYAWVFVGPADEGMAERIGAISASSGAAMLLFAPVAHEDIPAWVAHCEVCAVPYRLNSFTRASSPLKAIEYLGASAPVIATEIPSLRAYKDVIFWIREGDGASYADALDAARDTATVADAATKRHAAVKDVSWSHQARKFNDLICRPMQPVTAFDAEEPVIA